MIIVEKTYGKDINLNIRIYPFKCPCIYPYILIYWYIFAKKYMAKIYLYIHPCLSIHTHPYINLSWCMSIDASCVRGMIGFLLWTRIKRTYQHLIQISHCQMQRTFHIENKYSRTRWRCCYLSIIMIVVSDLWQSSGKLKRNDFAIILSRCPTAQFFAISVMPFLNHHFDWQLNYLCSYERCH